MVLILQSDMYVRIIDLYLWIESANMDISAGLKPKLLTYGSLEDARIPSIKFVDKALQDQICYKIIENVILIMKLYCNLI